MSDVTWQRDPFEPRRPRARIPLHGYAATPSTETHHTRHIRPAHIGVAVGVLVVLGMAAYAVAQVREGMQSLDGMPSIPAWAWAFVVGYVLGLRRGKRIGRWVQAIAHSYKGVFHGHANLIRGRH